LFTSDGNLAETWTNDDPRHDYDLWMSWDQHLRDDLLFVRHVHAMADAMEAVIGIDYEPFSEAEEGDSVSDLQRVVQSILEPLSAIALPDPRNPGYPDLPEIFWSRSVDPMV